MTLLLNPRTFKGENLDPETRSLFQKTIDWFENKGLDAIKQEDMEFKWYKDFLRFQKQEKLFATMLTPEGYGKEGSRYDLERISQFNELLGFYSMAHRYAFQVSILGTGPIWMSGNEAIKKHTADLLADGEIFGFGVSEKEHGADLYSNEMTLTSDGDGRFRANGNKYYIGNANKGFISTIGKIPETGEYAFFLVDSKNRHYDAQKRIRTSCIHCSYVGQYELIEYPIAEEDILSKGNKALQDALATVNIGKFQVGVAPVGACTHALYESINHANNRVIYGKRVTEFHHIQELFVEAYCRLTAMKLYNTRAIDYIKVSSADDRRYLIYTPVSKMKVGMEAIRVTQCLLDVVAAKGFETDTFLEMTLRDVAASSRLEGTAHVNMSLIIKFIDNYLFGNTQFEVPSKQDQPSDDNAIFNQVFGDMRNIAFPEYDRAYQSVDLPNVNTFKSQLDLLRDLFNNARPNAAQLKNLAYMYNLGEMFTLSPYAQLILESCLHHGVDDNLLNRIFGYMVADFSTYAVKQITSQENSEACENLLYKMIQKPDNSKQGFNKIWQEHVLPLDGIYKMNP